MRMRERLAPMLLLGAVLAVSACASDEEKARRAEEKMVELAKVDAQAESLFVHDSLAVAASITVDTVSSAGYFPALVNPDGDTLAPSQSLARSRSGATCMLDSATAMRVAPGDTLRCQWLPAVLHP